MGNHPVNEIITTQMSFSNGRFNFKDSFLNRKDGDADVAPTQIENKNIPLKFWFDLRRIGINKSNHGYLKTENCIIILIGHHLSEIVGISCRSGFVKNLDNF